MDDNRAIHDDIRKSLSGAPPSAQETEEMETLLFGDGTREAPTHKPSIQFEISSAYQGEDGIELVRRAVSEGRPYALVFMDVRIPPGCDGIEALTRIWQVDPALQAVICSAYSDYSWTALVERLPRVDGFLILRKPFDSSEVRQMAYALTEKWNAHANSLAAYATLHESETSQRALLHAIPDTILRIKADGTCRGLKPSEHGSAALAVYGDALPGEMARHLMDGVRRAIDDQTTQRVEFDLTTEQSLRHFDAQLVSMGGDEVVAIVRDITDIMRASIQEALGREREAIIRAQAEVLAQISMPFIPINERVAVMPLIGDMDGRRVARIRDTLVQRLSECKASTAILDLTGIGSLDATGAVELLRTVQSARLLGTELILTGVRSTIAQRLVELGTDFRGVAVRQTLQDGIDLGMRLR